MPNPELAAREIDDFRHEVNELFGDIEDSYRMGASAEAAGEQTGPAPADPFSDTCPFGNCPFDPDGRDCPACIAEAVEMEDVADDEFCGCLECLGGEEETEWEWEDYEDDPGEYVEWQDIYGGDEDPPFPID